MRENRPRGLYRPEFEHDACGVGIVADILGRRSHHMVEMGLEVLENLAHRAATGSDPKTGDGGGMLLQLPHAFFKKRAADNGIPLPDPGQYGVGMVFLPRDADDRAACQALVETVIREEDQTVLGWRDVPVDNYGIGVIARDSEPVISQVFVGRAASLLDQDAFERKLYVIRKVIEGRINQSEERVKQAFYIPSLSSNTIVYKGLLMPEQVRGFYRDLSDPLMDSAFVLVHSRFSTNTLGSWRLAHPYRYLAHNGEINPLRGNINWMTARETAMSSSLFGDDLKKLLPVLTPGASDTATIDNALELLTLAGRSLPHVMAMLIPEAWEGATDIRPEKRAFYEYDSFLMEPWDGPALIAFTDGKRIGANLDRNGLRPFRYTVTKDNLIVMGSETGVLPIEPEDVLYKGRLRPGQMMLIDPLEGRILDDEEIKRGLAARQPYAKWLADNEVRVNDQPSADHKVRMEDPRTLIQRQRTFGYTREELSMILQPMLETGAEAIGSMGTDTPLAVLSDKPQMVFNYFKQLFAQVTNPPLDAIREELVTSLEAPLGAERNLLAETPEHSRQIRLSHPVLTNEELERIRHINTKDIRAITLTTLFPVKGAVGSMEAALKGVCAQAAKAVNDGYSIVILSDRGVDAAHAPIPSLLACSAVHHHLMRLGLRTRVGIVVESGEPRDVMHHALLIGYGAGAVNPYGVYEIIKNVEHHGILQNGVDAKTAQKNFIKAIEKGVLKAASKMGISTIQSYRGAQIFEAVGLDAETINKYFTWTPSGVGGVGIDVLEQEARQRHSRAFDSVHLAASLELDAGGNHQWRRDGEHHMYNPESIARLQHAARTNSYKAYREFAELIDKQDKQLSTLRGLLDFKWAGKPLPLEEVEPASEIVKRFATGAISLGAISKEAHETLAISTNRIGARSNTGEGGEDYRRFTPDSNGDSRSSAIKQVASGRFGVTTNYLVNAQDLQIKMAQGAKPGEGGQLPGHKVDEYIGWVRHTTPGVELISPPPHHDIYSIEDLAQLIHDLKNVNPQARIHVKLVSEVGVGTVAAGVSKAHADVVLISGDSGGTGASPESSIKNAGLPWELGLAETQQVLVQNDLRSRIVVQTDGQLKTGRDVAIACLLGAEEFGFATAPLVTLGCIMLRKCHLNACSVGIATQDPELRKFFSGKPEYVSNYFYMLAEHLREIMAGLGFRTVNEMVGHVERLDSRKAIDHWKAKGIDFSRLLYRPEEADRVPAYHIQEQDHGLEKSLDHQLIKLAEASISREASTKASLPIRNSNRTVGAMLSGLVAKKYGEDGLPDDTIQFHFTGTAGLSFGAFLARGISLTLEGEANDYIGKGMSGGRIVVYPPKGSTFVPEENTIIGNVALYGATGGMAFIRGIGGERFAVRNSGAHAVVEGVGDHGCEYMTGGMVVVLGNTGRNFAAGMSGGIAYVLDEDGHFRDRCNMGMVTLEPVEDSDDQLALKQMVEWHVWYTGSARGKKILDNWDITPSKFVKVMPRDYRRVLNSHDLRNPVEVEMVLGGHSHTHLPAPV